MVYFYYKGEFAMHKNDAAELFKVLGNPNRVKMLKILYNTESVSKNQFAKAFDCDDKALRYHLDLLTKCNLFKMNVTNESETYVCNRELVDELMSFVSTRCKCCDTINE